MISKHAYPKPPDQIKPHHRQTYIPSPAPDRLKNSLTGLAQIDLISTSVLNINHSTAAKTIFLPNPKMLSDQIYVMIPNNKLALI